MIEGMRAGARSVGRAVRRPATYTGQVRELTSTVVTTALWPLGWRDRPPSAVGDGRDPLDHLEAEVPGEATTPVLLVHGFGANKSNWLFVTRYLHHAGFRRIDALNYNPITEDVPALSARLMARAEQLKARYGVERVHLIGHSMGGIIIRYAVQVDGLDGVGVAATISSPHGGNGLARYRLPFTTGLFEAGLQLAPDSTVMRLFRSTARPLPTRFVAYYSNLDLIVPARRAMILEPELGATNVLIKDHGHLSIMWSRRLGSAVAAELAAADRPVGETEILVA
jgi:pimeloyl-ACP methyl ester carboxylesterase